MVPLLTMLHLNMNRLIFARIRSYISYMVIYDFTQAPFNP